MTWMSTQQNAYRKKEFRTERRPAQKVIAGDMIYFKGDFVEVVESRHTRVAVNEHEGSLALSSSHPHQPRFEVKITLMAKEGKELMSAEPVGTWVIVLVDSTEEAKMLMQTTADYDDLKREINLVLDNVEAYFHPDVNDINGDSKSEVKRKAGNALGEFLRLRREDPIKWW